MDAGVLRPVPPVVNTPRLDVSSTLDLSRLVHVKRRDLIKRLKDIAKQRGVTYTEKEGGAHTIVAVGGQQTSVPRHSEINEITASKIIRQIEQTEQTEG